MKKTILAALTLAICGCGPDSNSTSAGAPPGGTTSQTSPTSSYPVRIVGELPPGAVQLRFIGANEEGDPVFNTSQPAATSVTVRLTPDISTLRLEYLDSGGRILATFVESAKNLQEHDFREGIDNPHLVILPPVQARASDNPVVGNDIKFSFAFFGCAAAAVPAEDVEGQLNQTELEAHTNVAQLRQHLHDVQTVQPKPKYVFLCGDMVKEPQSTADLDKELTAWHKIRAHGPVIIDLQGTEQAVTPPADGSVFPSGINLVAVPGHEEMCSQGLPNKAAGDVFVAQMGEFIRGNNGPKPGDALDDGGLGLPQDNVQRDESKLSYSFRDGENFFLVVNTDTYTGDGAANLAQVPLRWIRQQLRTAQQDASVKHIFVFGHRPLENQQFSQLLNNPSATTPENLRYPDANTKVRGYFCAHKHLMSTLEPNSNGLVQQLVCGAGGSQPDLVNGTPYPWYGFGLVGVTQSDRVDAAFIGRNVHRHWADQEALKLRGPNVSGPGPAEAKTPKMVQRLSPHLLTLPSYLQATPDIQYTSTFESDFTKHSDWTIETFPDYPRAAVEYHTENVEYLNGGGVKLKVAGKHDSRSSKVWLVHSGRVRSNFRQKYGLFLYQAKVPKVKHLWPALWTAGPVGEPNDIWPRRGEIDVMETVGTVAQRGDFTSRIMVRTNQPNFPDYHDYINKPWFASMPPDLSDLIKTFFNAGQWSQTHTYGVDWYKVMTGGVVTDVRYDFYLDVKVNAQGRLVDASDESRPPHRLSSYSLKDLIKEQNKLGADFHVPDLATLSDEWGEQAFVLNIAVGGGWDPEFGEVKNGTWSPPTDGSADMVVDWVKCYKRSDNP